MDAEEKIEEVNAIITAAKFDTDRGLSFWLTLDYGGSGQGFGGYLLYTPKDWGLHKGNNFYKQWNYAGHYIYRVLQIADVTDVSKLIGKSIRVRKTWSKVHAIGHIIKDDWFNPAEDFEKVPKPEAGSN